MSKLSPVKLPTMVAVLALFTAFAAGSDCSDPDADTIGRVTDHDGTPFCPIVLPWEVCVDELDAADLAIPTGRAMRWWQEQACRDGVPRDWFVHATTGECHESTLGVVYVYAGVPTTPGAYAEVTYTPNAFGDIPCCNVVVASEWLWLGDDEVEVWMRHELGHAMGLAHDLAETGSIMVTPTPRNAVLTDHDFDVLVAGCE